MDHLERARITKAFRASALDKHPEFKDQASGQLRAMLAEWLPLVERVSKGYDSLSAPVKALLGPLPKISSKGRPNTMADLEQYIVLDHQIAEFSKTRPVAKPAPAPSLGAKALEAVTNPKTAGPAAAGVRESINLISAEMFASQNSKPAMLMSEFRLLSQSDRSAFIRSGGRLVDEPEAEVPPIKPGQKQITLAQFRTLPHAKRGEFFRAGGKLID